MNGQLQSGKPDRLFVPNKEDGFVYHWANSNDRNLFEVDFEGWEAAPQSAVESLTRINPSVLGVTGQQVNDPGGGTTVRRGDLILVRMPIERWEKNIATPSRVARERQGASIDTMVSQANEDAKKAARDAGQKNIPKTLVFREDVGDPND